MPETLHLLQQRNRGARIWLRYPLRERGYEEVRCALGEEENAVTAPAQNRRHFGHLLEDSSRAPAIEYL